MIFIEEYDIKANRTILVIGKISGLYINDNLIEKDQLLLGSIRSAALYHVETVPTPTIGI